MMKSVVAETLALLRARAPLGALPPIQLRLSSLPLAKATHPSPARGEGLIECLEALSLHKPLADDVLLARVAFQLLAEPGMRDRNERVGAFRHRLALEVHDAVLGRDIHGVDPRRGHDVAGRQAGHN